jgi:hypothetical protein
MPCGTAAAISCSRESNPTVFSISICCASSGPMWRSTKWRAPADRVDEDVVT